MKFHVIINDANSSLFTNSGFGVGKGEGLGSGDMYGNSYPRINNLYYNPDGYTCGNGDGSGYDGAGGNEFEIDYCAGFGSGCGTDLGTDK